MKQDYISALKAFQQWRTGKDDRTMDEAGIVPAQVTAAIDYAIAKLESLKWKELKHDCWPKDSEICELRVPLINYPDNSVLGWYCIDQKDWFSVSDEHLGITASDITHFRSLVELDA